MSNEKTFTFWKDNRKDQEYTLTESELKEKYLAYLQTKDADWITYYGHHTVAAFISADDGLHSVPDDLETLQELLMPVRHSLKCYDND